MILPDIYRASPAGSWSSKPDQQPADASWSETMIPAAGKFQITSSEEAAANPYRGTERTLTASDLIPPT